VRASYARRAVVVGHALNARAIARSAPPAASGAASVQFFRVFFV